MKLVWISILRGSDAQNQTSSWCEMPKQRHWHKCESNDATQRPCKCSCPKHQIAGRRKKTVTIFQRLTRIAGHVIKRSGGCCSNQEAAANGDPSAKEVPEYVPRYKGSSMRSKGRAHSESKRYCNQDQTGKTQPDSGFPRLSQGPEGRCQIYRPVVKRAARDRACDHARIAQRDQVLHP